jgi:outer membrane protein OmpA-like peptidoglycan-associated protein
VRPIFFEEWGMARRLKTFSAGLLGLSLAGCSVPIALYHKAEGGAIAQPRQDPPGSTLPYPNLASVPAAPAALTPGQQQAVDARINGSSPGVSPASPGALAGLELPAGPPPVPNVPGLNLPALPSPAPDAPPRNVPVGAAPAPKDGVPVALGFVPGSALLNFDSAQALSGIAASRGAASVLVAGFGDAAGPPGDTAALNLALARAARLAAGLTAAGVPPTAIRLTAAAAGSGGYVQLVY